MTEQELRLLVRDAIARQTGAAASPASPHPRTFAPSSHLSHAMFTLTTGADGDISIQRQRRVSRSLDADAAEEILANAGVLDDCYKTVRVIDEDAVMQALYSETLTEADVDAIFPSKVTWALVIK